MYAHARAHNNVNVTTMVIPMLGVEQTGTARDEPFATHNESERLPPA